MCINQSQQSCPSNSARSLTSETAFHSHSADTASNMRILFLCTAHNSLSQRLFLALSRTHDVSIEYALSDEAMITAVALFEPELIICPFLTTLVPKEIYNHYMTLIVHPGPPGDVGPSALDWVLMGDDGTIDDPNELLRVLDSQDHAQDGRTHWGITVLQAIEEVRSQECQVKTAGEDHRSLLKRLHTQNHRLTHR